MTSPPGSSAGSPQGAQSTHLNGGRRDGSTPPPATNFRIKWADELRCKTGVYVRRWVLETPWFSFRLHHWLHSDDSRALHDHTWWFVTLILYGCYVDVTSTGEELLRAGSIRWRPPKHAHYVRVPPGGCWSLLLTGPIVREFGFWVRGRWRKSNRYFYDFGEHICD